MPTKKMVKGYVSAGHCTPFSRGLPNCCGNAVPCTILYPWWTSHKPTDESESCRLLLGDGVTGWLGLVQVRQSLIQLHLGCLLLTLRGTVQEPKVNRQGPNLGQKNGFHPQKLRNLEGLTTSFWECLRLETTQTLEGVLLLKGTHWPTTIGTDLAIFSSLAHHKEPVHLRSWRPLLRIRPSDHSPVCAAANLRLCICILPCSHIAWHSTNPYKSTICTEAIALHALWQDSVKVFPRVPYQWIQLLAHLLSFLVSLSFLCHDLPNSERRSASMARIAERRAELLWRFWEKPSPLLCMVYQDVLIHIVPQLGISTVFGQIHLSITPHIHEFSRGTFGLKKKTCSKTDDSDCKFSFGFLQVSQYFLEGFALTAQSVWHNPHLWSFVAGTSWNPLTFESNRCLLQQGCGLLLFGS